jgi:uncharacterized membrane protein SirB2
MSYSYDFQMAEIHALIAWATLVLFVLRGLAVLVHGMDWAMDARLRVLVFGMHFLLAITGLSLWALYHYDPRYDSWLAAKLIGLAAFGACAHWGLGRERFDIWGYLGALFCLAYVAGVSVTRSPWLGLF